MLQIILSDDGRGIELERLRAKVVERGLTSAGDRRRLSEAELLDFSSCPVFQPRSMSPRSPAAVSGSTWFKAWCARSAARFAMASRPGKGTRFILQLPITVSVIRALLVEIAGEPYAFPLSRIDRIFMLDRKDVRELEGKPHTMLDDQPVGLVEAAVVLDLPAGATRGAAELLPSWLPATGAIGSAWWLTGSWASATCASRRWTLGWARCPISTALRCSRTAGRS